MAVSINVVFVVLGVGVLVSSLDALEHDSRTRILPVNNCLVVLVVVLGMRRFVFVVLDGNSCLGLCNAGMLEPDIVLRGMDVLIVLLIGVVIVAYVFDCGVY